jgi:hypothetical protein
VRFRFAQQPVVQAVGIPNFTPAFLAGMLTDILALRGVHGLGEKMVEWHRTKQQI